MSAEEEPVPLHFLLLHGFEPGEAMAILRAAKAAVKDPENVAASVSTPTNRGWKLGDLIDHVAKEHAWFREKGTAMPD